MRQEAPFSAIRGSLLAGAIVVARSEEAPVHPRPALPFGSIAFARTAGERSPQNGGFSRRERAGKASAGAFAEAFRDALRIEGSQGCTGRSPAVSGFRRRLRHERPQGYALGVPSA
jgi:hypothetical protein